MHNSDTKSSVWTNNILHNSLIKSVKVYLMDNPWNCYALNRYTNLPLIKELNPEMTHKHYSCAVVLSPLLSHSSGKAIERPTSLSSVRLLFDIKLWSLLVQVAGVKVIYIHGARFGCPLSPNKCPSSRTHSHNNIPEIDVHNRKMGVQIHLQILPHCDW